MPLVLSSTGTESESKTQAEQHYEKANELRKVADYDAAISEYEKAISSSPKSEIAQNARYWIAQSHFSARRFDVALSAFQKLLDESPTGTNVSSVKLMIERIQQVQKNRALFEAVKKGDIEQVKSLIIDGADIDAKWDDTCTKEERKNAQARDIDETPLCYAANTNNLEIVKFLVEAGADVNEGYFTPLVLAVENNNMEITKYLIDHGADINPQRDWGPLQAAVYNNESNIEMVRFLLDKGSDINISGRRNYPPLRLAIVSDLRDIVELLIQRGADLNIKNPSGSTPLHAAIIKEKTEYVQLLLEAGADINAEDDSGLTALYIAAQKGYNNIVELLLSKGADINARNHSGLTALHISGQNGDSNAVELLLKKVADINVKDTQDGYTALHLAVKFGKMDMIKLLIDKGADINAKDKNGRTPLHLAAKSADAGIVELLLNKDADINVKDNESHTPLYIAVNSDYKIAELLINKGADSSIETDSGRTLLRLAEERKQIESTIPDMIFDGDPNSHFGHIIVCSDIDRDGYDDILIGSHMYHNKRGRVYLFYGGHDMDSKTDLIFEGQDDGDYFGGSIACGDIDNDGYEDIIIGASGYSNNLGRTYLYWGNERNSMNTNPDKIFTGENGKSSRFGTNSAIYDIDNDGYDDIIIGAYWYPSDGTGQAYLYYGNTKELMDISYDLIFKPENPEDRRFSYTIRCGDVDNDGYGDIVINSSDKWKQYFYYGDNKSNIDANADVIFEINSEGVYSFGNGLVCFDQNRDGYDDLVVGDTKFNNSQGRIYIFHGNSKKSMDTNHDIIIDGEVEQSLFGVRAVGGDIDGDNVSDLVIAANGSGSRVGRVYVYCGKELTGSDPRPCKILTGENANDSFGVGLACGDVNKDGFDDIVVGAYEYKAGANQGRVYLYYGGARNK